MVNRFTPAWFTTYLKTYGEAFTANELAFIMRQAPLPTYRAALDLCCGDGRLAIPLAERGYQVTGVERDSAMVADARARAGDSARFIQTDMRDLREAPGSFDVVVNMWHSFGFFDANTNASIVRQIYEKLNPRGRFIIDIYNRAWFVEHQGTETAERDGRHITSTRTMHGDRLTVHIDYGADLTPDTFNWQLYTPQEFIALAEDIGFQRLVACAWTDESRAITAADARMQLVFEKR
ncbi:MAG TPA: class I SAM-dependent methyltransferase [Ktedonobacterales bacterium]|nr:class I SAM-dependent methyltransferase [Ktedonobacterales bacterium]